MRVRLMVVFVSLFYIFFNVISCNKKDSLDATHADKETEVVENEEDENGNDENQQEEGEKGEDPNFNYDDQFKVDNGFHVPFALGDTPSPYGYYMFFPESYKQLENHYPLLIFLHGSGERGNSRTNKSELDRAIKHGPGKLINNGTWAPKEEMLVVSAQTVVNKWDSEGVRKLIEYLLETYRIDEKRIYLTGLSLGSFGTFDYLGKYGADSKIAAAVPICGRGISSNNTYVKNVSNVPLWIFHGEADQQVPVARAKEITDALNAVKSKVKPKLTLYPNVPHDSWTMTYDGSGRGKENPNYDAFDRDIYSWMLQYRLP